MKKIIYSIIFLLQISCAKRYNIRYKKSQTPLFNCALYYKPQSLLPMKEDNKDNFNIIEANVRILFNKNKGLKKVIQCQKEQLDIFTK